MKEDCVLGDDPDRQIGGCTAVIQSGMFADDPGNLAIAYNNRGIAYGKRPVHGLLHVLGDEGANGKHSTRARRVSNLEIAFDLGVIPG